MKFYKTDWFLKVISILIAIVIWTYVVYQTNPRYDKWIRDIPVTYTNMSADFESGKLIVLEQQTFTIDVKISGTRRSVSTVNSSNISATIDLSSISESGEYSLPIKIKFETENIEILKKKPSVLKTLIDDVDTISMDVDLDTKGSVKDGYIVKNIGGDGSIVKLTGPKTILVNIKKASVSVDLAGAMEDVKGLYKIKLYDSSGAEITDERISKNIEYIDVHYDVYQIKEININPVLSSNINAFGEVVSVTEINPVMVLVKGGYTAIESITQINTVPIDISEITLDTQIETELQLPDNIELVNPESKVKINLEVVK